MKMFPKFLPNFLYNFFYGISNLIFFFKVIWRFRFWDHVFLFQIFKAAIDKMANETKLYGIEYHEIREVKIKKMKRASELFKHFIDNDFIEIAEKQIGSSLALFNFDFDKIFTKCKDFEFNEEPRYEYKDSRTSKQKENDSKIFNLSHELEEQYWKELKEILFGSGEETQYVDGTSMRCWWE